MSTWSGFGPLQTTADLLAKLRHDLARMQADPGDGFAAFDFFVTAECMVDWHWPDDPARRSAVRKTDPLATVSHMASGAKHFQAKQARHTSVDDVAVDASIGLGSALPGLAVPGMTMPGAVVFDLSIVVEMVDGRRLPAIDVARTILDYWTAELEDAT